MHQFKFLEIGMGSGNRFDTIAMQFTGDIPGGDLVATGTGFPAFQQIV